MTSGNSAMQLRRGSGWSRGLSSMLRGELGQWFGSRHWLSQIITWALIVNGIVLAAALQMPKSQATEALMIYNIFMGMAPPVGVAILMMGAVVEEKRSGTAAWILSKPVSRTAFVLSKLLGNGAGILVCLLAAQGVLGFLIMRFFTDLPLQPLRFVAGMGAHAANLAFYTTLGVMLGVLFQHPGPVVGIPIAFNFVQQYIPSLLPFLKGWLPWGLAVPPNDSNVPSIASALMLGIKGPPLYPFIFALGGAAIFVVVAVAVFQRQEL
jgi:ABC-2 type transport system permease protein